MQIDKLFINTINKYILLIFRFFFLNLHFENFNFYYGKFHSIST